MKNTWLISWVLAGVALATSSTSAQTNSPATNRLPAELSPLQRNVAAKRLTIARLNQYFNVEFDSVKDYSIITQRNSAYTTDRHTKAYLLCFLDKGSTNPTGICIKFVSRSPDWRYLKYGDCVLKYDDQKKEFGELKDDGDVLQDGDVLEQLRAELDMNELKAIAKSTPVMGDLGSDTIKLTQEFRAEWQVLIDYFTAIQTENKPTPQPTDPAQKLPPI